MSTSLPIIKSLINASVLVVGDIMLDSYVYGSIDRISPEAPIPVLKIESRKEMLGGCGNVFTNLNTLGAKSGIISLVGKDTSAEKIENILVTFPRGKHYLLKVDKVPTVTKTRFVSGNQQLLRTDVEEVLAISEEIENQIISKVLSIIDNYNVIILSDYKKGLLSRKVCSSIIDIAKGKGVFVFVDPKGKDYSLYKGATLIKPNLKELREVFAHEEIKGQEIQYARKLLVEYDIQYCLITMGKDGMLLVGRDSEKSFTSIKREVYDVSGAGDTVVATLAACYSAGASIDDACQVANIAGGIVVAKAGTSSVIPSEIENELHPNGKVFNLDELTHQVDQWRKEKYKIGFTNGCFDILHAGHIKTLTFAKKNCDKLIVALNTDSSVRKLKGPSRPINSESERCLVIVEMQSVDGVILFEEDTPENLILRIKPDVLIKGGDYKKEDVVGYSFLRSYGGEVLMAPLINKLSTTNIVSKI